MQQVKDIRKINPKSLILPELIPLIIPDFVNHSKPVLPYVLSFEKISSEEWFMKFVNDVEGKMGKEYFPVMRMSDGEYAFLIGEKFPYFSSYNNMFSYLQQCISIFKSKYIYKKNYNAATLPNVSSGNYKIDEIDKQRKNIVEKIREISLKGVLALHLTYPMKPFQEHYHYPLKKLFIKNDIKLTNKNYYPFYFVYALLRGPLKKRILENKNILILHSATGEKRNKIIKSLHKENVSSVIWHEISSNRSMFDKIDLKEKYFEADVAFIGAGVGKFNIFSQLEDLKIPCIDIGFVFEVWANEENKLLRPYMVNDSEWDNSKINF